MKVVLFLPSPENIFETVTTVSCRSIFLYRIYKCSRFLFAETKCEQSEHVCSRNF